MSTQLTAGEGVPSVFYRNAIDLNRFSNGIARKLAQENVNVIIRAVEQLKKIDESKGPSYRAARLRSLIKQTKKTLSSWQEKSVDVMIEELENVARVQAGFVENQLKKALPAGMQKQIVEEIGYSVQSVAVSPGFAKAVVTNTPTKLNLGQAGKFNLTAKQGSEVLLPNGETISKAFRGLATKQANQFNQIVRTGLLSGETTRDITRQLVGNLDFGEKAKTIKQLNMAGGEVTKIATNQINTIVRTSINQVSNAASQSVYKANKKITKEYRYISTLDSRTSTICRNLDGQIFEYGKGPEPPQHFGCRSTTVPVIDYKGNGWPAPPSVTTAKRASADGPVPANTTYGKWLYDNRKSGTKFTPGPEQIKALGKEKAKYFNRLANKYGPDQAMSKFMREDGSEVTLKKLESRYGKPEDIKPKPKPKLVDWDAVSKSPKTKAALKESKKLSEQISKIKAPVVNEAYKNEIKNFSQNELTNLKTFLEQSIDTSSKGSKQYSQSVSELNVVNSLLKTKPKYVKLTDAQKKLVDKQIQSKIKKTPVTEVATFKKLSAGDQSEINFLKGLKLDSENKKDYWKASKALYTEIIPKGKFKTITPKELARRLEDSKIAKLQTKLDKAAKKALQPKKDIDSRRWDDPSLLNKDLAIESYKSSVRKQSAKGKTTTRDLFFKPKATEVGLTPSEYTQTGKLLKEWSSAGYMDVRGVQIQQAKTVGAQLNPGQVQTLKRFKARTGYGRTEAKASSIQSEWARNADKMENFIAKNPKWKGLPEDLLPNQVESDGTIFRGMAFDDFEVVQSIIESYKNADPSLAMESWSASRRVAGDFLEGELKTNQVLLKQVNKYGTSIQPWNELDEREILQPRGVRYQVKSVKTKRWKDTIDIDEDEVDYTFTEIVLEAY